MVVLGNREVEGREKVGGEMEGVKGVKEMEGERVEKVEREPRVREGLGKGRGWYYGV